MIIFISMTVVQEKKISAKLTCMRAVSEDGSVSCSHNWLNVISNESMASNERSREDMNNIHGFGMPYKGLH